MERNNDDDKIISTYGWIMEYFLNKKEPIKPITESNFQNYIALLKNKGLPLESFWYMDGNSLPYNLSSEEEQFLNDNFTLKESLEKYDTWARHYISKNPPKEDMSALSFKNFTPANFDSNGNLMMFKNSKIKSPVIDLEKGEYTLTINANSLPDKPIKGENAHFIIKLNGEEIGNYYLSEKTENKEKKINFECKTFRKARIWIIFDNDLSINNLDRNVIIYNVALEKK